MTAPLLDRIRAAIADPGSFVGPRERGNPDCWDDAGETVSNWSARAVLKVLASLGDVEALIAGADRAYAYENHDDLCHCVSWPDACVSGLHPDTWLTGATDTAVKYVLAQLGVTS